MSNAAISWCSHGQDILAVSSTEAEYIALSETNKIIWLREMVNEIDKIDEASIQLFI